MARSREAPLLLGLGLLVLLAASGSGDAAVLRGCQPEVLAGTVSLACVGRLPTAWCCRALAHSARVGSGARCLCRLAADATLASAALNATDLLRLYAACAADARLHRHGGGAAYPPFASESACDGDGDDEGARAEAPAPAPTDASDCAAASLADQMELFCGGGASASPNFPCCEAVVGSVRMGADGVPCPCHVARCSSAFDAGRIADLYAACGAADPDVARRIADKCAGPPSPNLLV